MGARTWIFLRILIFLEAFSWSSGSGQSGQLVQDRVAPRIRVEQPGMHLHDQRHGEIFPVWFLDHPSTCLHVLVHVWIDEHEDDCSSFTVDLWYGGSRGGGSPETEDAQVISKLACSYNNLGIVTRDVGKSLL
jgi:hypothetical protein